MAAETFIQYPVDEFSSSDFNIPGEGDYRLASFSIFIPIHTFWALCPSAAAVATTTRNREEAVSQLPKQPDGTLCENS